MNQSTPSGACLLAIWMVLLCCSSLRTEPSGSPTKRPDATVCPNGHAKLEKVPIVYGLLSHLGKAEKDRTPEERDLAGKIKRREIIWGGCCIGNDSPDHFLRCQQCGFELRCLRVSQDMDFWTRTSTKPEHLESFSSYAQKLAVASSALQPLCWVTSQELFNGLRAHEQMDFEILPAQFASLKGTLSKWADDLHLPDSYVPAQIEAIQPAFLASSIRPDHHYVRLVITLTETQRIHVALIVCHEDHADKWLRTQTTGRGTPDGLR